MGPVRSAALAGVEAGAGFKNDTLTWSQELYRILAVIQRCRRPLTRKHSSLFTAESWDDEPRHRKGLHAGTPYELDLEMVRPDGTERWVTSRGEAEHDNTGSMSGFVHGSRHNRSQKK